MNIFDNLALGLTIALTPANLAYCFAGALVGTLVGVLPGIGPVVAIAILMPFTFQLDPVSALIMLAGIYYGANHSGSTTAIMLNMPGEPSAAVICLDGYPMAQQGRAGPALCISAIGSFVAGCIAVAIIAFFSPTLTRAALSFGTPEYAAAIVLALIVASSVSNSSLALTIGMALLGLLLSVVGRDLTTGVPRFTFGFNDLADGVDVIIVAIAFYAIAEIVEALVEEAAGKPVFPKVMRFLPTGEDIKASWKPVLRGTALGSAIGIFPGTGPVLSSFASYAVEQRLAKQPERFGRGAIEGVAGPESAANAAAITHFIPMLTLGIPAGAAFALMLAAMIVQGVTPGPRLMMNHPELFWGVIVSMWVGNAMLLILNLPLVGIWIRLLAIPYRFLYPAIVVFCCVGVYSVNRSEFDVLLTAGLSIAGYVFRHLGCAPTPMILGLVLGTILEDNIRRALLLSNGDPSIFVTRPISLSLLILAGVLMILLAAPALRLRSKQ